ncbi:polysaccharide deacetylase family protein [Niallia sp. Krafla_26]|uniref:polysaccharide deacetylase family protein n=1 Tax=Niallia sp. Krafla_26 TaxID=3064703 RepID=UPI003D177BC1
MTFSVMFHYFHDNNRYKKAQGSLSSLELESIINSDKYEVLSADNWLQMYKEKSLKTNQVCFSFDDGLKEQLDIALPVLEKYGLKAIWNINTNPTLGNLDKLEAYRNFRNYFFADIDDFYNKFFIEVEKLSQVDCEKICNNVDFNQYLKDSTFYSFNDRKFRYFRDEILKDDYFNIMDNMIKEKVEIDTLRDKLWMNKEDIKSLADKGHKIGLHTHLHSTNLDRLDYEEQYEDFKLNKTILEEIIQQEVTVAAYPCGKYNTESIRVLEELGIEYAFLAHKKGSNNNYEIDRIDCADILKEV